MTAQVFDFPSQPSAMPPRRVFGTLPHPRREYRFHQVVALLALDDAEVTIRTQLDYLRDYARQWGMPLPLNARRRHGRLIGGPESIGQRSRWCALEFDAWLDARRSPPPAAMALACPEQGRGVPPLPAFARADMAARARQLAGG